MVMTMVSQKYLKDILSYDPDTGLFHWIINRTGVTIGMQAGSINKQGYVRIEVDGKSYAAHRLAWLYVYGYMPSKVEYIDHIDRTKDNNQIDNLRIANHSENKLNSGLPKNNKTGYKGVQMHGERFRAQTTINSKRVHLGTFDTALDAYNAYVKAVQSHHGKDVLL